MELGEVSRILDTFCDSGLTFLSNATLITKTDKTHSCNHSAVTSDLLLNL